MRCARQAYLMRKIVFRPDRAGFKHKPEQSAGSRARATRRPGIRRSRLRQGALEWELLRDVNQPGRFVEQIVDESWTEHLRRFDRVTASDVALRERKLAFHIGDGPPVVTRCVVEAVARA